MTRLLVIAVAACSASATAPAPGPDRPSAAVVAAPPGKLVTSAAWMGPVRELRAAGAAVDVAQLREVAAALGLPVSGTADLDIAIDVPNGKPSQMTGHARIACTKCRLGDDQAKLHLGTSSRTSVFGGEGIDLGHVDFDRIDVAVDVANGRADIARWRVESPDLALELTGHVELSDSLGASRVTGCVRFKPGATLEKTRPKTFAVLSVTGAPLGDDGFYSIALEGTIDAMKRLGKVCH